MNTDLGAEVLLSSICSVGLAVVIRRVSLAEANGSVIKELAKGLLPLPSAKVCCQTPAPYSHASWLTSPSHFSSSSSIATAKDSIALEFVF